MAGNKPVFAEDKTAPELGKDLTPRRGQGSREGRHCGSKTISLHGPATLPSAPSADSRRTASEGKREDYLPVSGSNNIVQRSLVLVGFMAAGKSKIGRSLAEKLGLEFVDADRLIEADHGCSIAEIFRQHGEKRFREAEKSHILRLASEQARVIAVGGGAFVSEAIRETLIASTITIWLDTPFELVLQRLANSTTRPLASNRSEDELRALFDERRLAYRLAHIRVDTSDADIDRIVGRIVTALPA